MNLSIIMDFLKDLAANNDRQWFNANKDRYLAAQAEFEHLLTVLIARISEFDPAVRHVDAKSCPYRIYRDLRFTQDKTPYKIHMGAYIDAMGKKSLHCGYYFHLQPGDSSLFATGTYGLTTQMMHAVRQSVYNGIDEYRGIVDAPAFKKAFPQIGEERMKSAPKGFPKDFPYMDYLKPKDFTIWHPLTDSEVLADSFADQLTELCRQAKPFMDFLDFTIDDYI